MQPVEEDVQQQQYWDGLVERLATGDAGASAEFCRTYRPGIRFILQRRLGDGQLDKVVDTTVNRIVTEIAGRRMTTVAEMSRFIRKAVPAGQPASSAPSLGGADRERLGGRVKTLDQVLETFSSVEREALICFYARGFSERDVEAEFGYDTVSFRSLRERLVRSLNTARARRGAASASRAPLMRGSAAGAA